MRGWDPSGWCGWVGLAYSRHFCHFGDELLEICGHREGLCEYMVAVDIYDDGVPFTSILTFHHEKGRRGRRDTNIWNKAVLLEKGNNSKRVSVTYVMSLTSGETCMLSKTQFPISDPVPDREYSLPESLVPPCRCSLRSAGLFVWNPGV